MRAPRAIAADGADAAWRVCEVTTTVDEPNVRAPWKGAATPELAPTALEAPDVDVLLDANGGAATGWRIAIYPSSFAVACGGRIRECIAGALDCNDPAVVRRLRARVASH